jgi:hypothetical protein
MTNFLIGYVVATGAGPAGDPGLKASRQPTGGALSVFEASIGAGPPLHVHDRDDERTRIGERYGIRVVSG